jgi:hypothetical protein
MGSERTIVIQCLVGLGLGALRGGLIILLSLSVTGALLLILVSGVGSVVAGASALMTRRRRGGSTVIGSSMALVVAAAISLAMILYATGRGFKDTVLIAVASLVVDLVVAYLGWPSLSRIMGGNDRNK